MRKLVALLLLLAFSLAPGGCSAVSPETAEPAAYVSGQEMCIRDRVLYGCKGSCRGNNDRLTANASPLDRSFLVFTPICIGRIVSSMQKNYLTN